MSVEENLRVLESHVEAINAHDWDRLAESLSESAVFYTPDSPEPLKGRDSLRERFRGFVNAFPDLQTEKVRAFGQGDWVSGEFVTSGTHKGPLPGPGGQTIPSTNKPVRIHACNVYKFEGGKITEVRQYYDALGMMAQLGLAPEGGP